MNVPYGGVSHTAYFIPYDSTTVYGEPRIKVRHTILGWYEVTVEYPSQNADAYGTIAPPGTTGGCTAGVSTCTYGPNNDICRQSLVDEGLASRKSLPQTCEDLRTGDASASGACDSCCWRGTSCAPYFNLTGGAPAPPAAPLSPLAPPPPDNVCACNGGSCDDWVVITNTSNNCQVVYSNCPNCDQCPAFLADCQAFI